MFEGGRCAGSCGLRTTYLPTNCCETCLETPGKHDPRCDSKTWSSEAIDPKRFSLCFPASSTLGGTQGLEAVSVTASAGCVEAVDQAVAHFWEHGFVVLKKALTDVAAKEVLEACRRIHAVVADEDPSGIGNRNPGRYSFNNCTGSGQCFHMEAFVKHVVDNSFVFDVLDRIYADSSAPGSGADGLEQPSRKSGDPLKSEEPYVISRATADLCCGWVEDFQRLNTDMCDARPFSGPPAPTAGPDGKPVHGWFGSTPYHTPAPVHDRKRPPAIAVSYAVQGLTRWNGAPRIVSWKEMQRFLEQRKGGEPPDLDEELKECPEWLTSRLFPLEAGDAVLRDVRVWYGGCPNLSGEARFLPSLEVTSPEYDVWFDEVFKKDTASDNAWMRALSSGFAAKIVDPRVKKRSAWLVEHDPKAETNYRVGDFGWIHQKLIKAQWPLSCPETGLGTAEVEVAGLLAALRRLASDSSDSKELLAALRSYAAEGLYMRNLDARLKAIETGSFSPLPLKSLEDVERCASLACSLRRTIASDEVSFQLDTVVDLTKLLEDGMHKLSQACTSELEDGASKKQRLASSDS